MNEQKWTLVMIQFQAQCRGYVMRKDLRMVHVQFEEIVQEIDGCLDHLHWKGNILPTPFFADTENPILQYSLSRNPAHDYQADPETEHKDSKEKVPPQPEILQPERDDDASGTAPLVPDEEERPERCTDDSPTLQSCENSDVNRRSVVLVRETMTLQVPMERDEEERAERCTDDSPTLQSCENSDVNSRSVIQNGPDLSVLNEVDQSKSLQQQRKTLVMELLWIQQAISSRKKYLTLRQNMGITL